MRWRWPYQIFLLAIGLGLMTSYLVYRWMAEQAEARVVPVEAPRPEKSVVAAGMDLLPGTKLGPESIKVIQLPLESVPSTAIDLEKAEGRVLLVPVVAGELILEPKLAPPGTEGGLSALVSPGKRAMTIRVDEMLGVTGLIVPGSYVDVLATMEDTQGRNLDATTKTILQNIKVLPSLGKSGGDKKESSSSMVTLEVDPEEAEKLALAAHRGRLQLALRNQVDDLQSQTRGLNTLELIRGPKPPAPIRMAKPEKSLMPEKVLIQEKPVEKPPERPSVEIIRGDQRSKQEY
jgi:pilus assembly protein CpaB